MAHIRVLKHYIHTPFLIAASLEALAIGVSAYTGFYTRYGRFPEFYDHLPYALSFAAITSFFMMAMGVYEARLREGFVGALLRRAVAMFLLGTLGMAVLLYLVPPLFEGRGVLLFATTEAFVLVTLIRWSTRRAVGDNFMKRRVVVLGTGERALKIANRMRRRSDQRAFILMGFMLQEDADDLVSEFGARILPYPGQGLLDYCTGNDIDEIVIATDDRRADSTNSPIPFDELMECRLSGVEVCEVQNFVEREACKIDVDLLQRSWLVYSDGFDTGTFRAITKRTFDILTASILLLLFSPIIVLCALIIAATGGFRAPIIYRQERVGLNGAPIQVLKFRTMHEDAETSGAMWADLHDPRITRFGRFLRRSHLDELPQLFSVLNGTMSMVGPRPERPVFVEELTDKVPFYEQRHRVKPGVTGWAQLCYPYGASITDAKEKLQYDLYYLKNHSLLLDLIILLQTVEVVLVGEGSR